MSSFVGLTSAYFRMVVPCIHLAIATAVPLVATSGAHELCLPFLAALTLWYIVLVKFWAVSTAGSDNDTGRITVAIVARIVRRPMMVVPLVDDQPVHAIVGFVIHVHEMLFPQPLQLFLLLL